MDNLTQLFYDEAYEMVAGMEQLLLSLEAQTPDPEVVNALFRYAHSFKGNSAAMGFNHLSRFTHGLESAMEVLRREQRPLTPQMTNLLLQAVDLIRALLERTRTEGDVKRPRLRPAAEPAQRGTRLRPVRPVRQVRRVRPSCPRRGGITPLSGAVPAGADPHR
jgi:chemotaxis protein histidine kinase CheA